MDARKDYLHTAKVCRFCLSQDDSLMSLYARKQSSKKTVPLSLKILSTLSVQTLPSDKLPSYICNRCKFFMDLCYQFKQMAQEADATTLQFVQDGTALEPVVWPLYLTKIFRFGTKQPDSNVVKTVVEGGATVEVSSQDASDSEDDDENVYNVKIGDGTEEGTSACVKVVTSKDEGPKSKNNKKDGAAESGAELSGLVDGCWACDECDCTYPLQQLLELHKMQKHRERNYSCDQCDAKFYNKSDLSVHMYRHVDEAPFECAVCDKKFKRLVLLKRHEKMVHSDMPQMQCSRCPVTFLSLNELEKHKQRHTGTNDTPSAYTVECKICEKRFPDKNRLQRHVATVHTITQQQLSCEYCPETFPSVPKLARHVRTHAGERPYPCKYCDKSFTKSHHYTRHLRVKHNCGESRSPRLSEEYRCEQCAATFYTQDELIYHSAIHATQNLTCPLCQEKFENVDAVTTHIKSHVHGMEFMCALCELVFTSKEKLEAHFTAAHDDEIRNAEMTSWYESEVDEEDDDDNSIKVKEEDDHMLVEIKKPNEFMSLNDNQEDAEEKINNTNSEGTESEPESSLPEQALTAKESPVKILKQAVIAASPAPPPAAALKTKTEKPSPNTTFNIIKKAEEIKRKVVQQTADTVVPLKKEKKAEPVSVGASDKSLRLLEKELQELKRTIIRNEVPKTPAKTIESRSSNRRPQMHTSTPKPRTIEEKKAQIQAKSTVPEKKVPERRAVKENKKPEEVKETKTNNGPVKEEKESKKDEKPTVSKDSKEEIKEKSISVKNGANNKSATEDGVRRSSRPSKVKDYAKMVRDRGDTASDEDSDDDDDNDEEVYAKASVSATEGRQKSKRAVQQKVQPKVVQKPAAEATSTPPVRKRGRPRKDASAYEAPSKARKEENDNDTSKNIKNDDEDASKTLDKSADDEDESGNTDNSKQDDDDKPPKLITTVTGQALKKVPMVPVKSLPPGVKPLPLPANARPIGGGELCEMQIGKKMVKVQKIVMTKAEVEAMAKKGLLELKDGTMVLKQGIKLPTTDPLAIKSTLVGEDATKQSPSKQEKALPTRCELDDA